VTTRTSHPATLTLVPLGGPTVLIEAAGLRLLVDPTFDPPGTYPIGQRALVKTQPSSSDPDSLGLIDYVLLSHDQHPDNLDTLGRAVVARTPTLTTVAAADRLGPTAIAMPIWTSRTITGPTGSEIVVTAVPAQHGPSGTEHLTGPVIGFVLQGDDLPTVYVSGDNASLAVVRAVRARWVVDVAVIFAGAARTPLVGGHLTLTSAEAVSATRLLGRPRVLAVHTDGWGHFTESYAVLAEEFANAGLAGLLLPAEPGSVVELA
jgi:L-ascorbate metabolism protein UlaG (beta-lactamase superfamily)